MKKILEYHFSTYTAIQIDVNEDGLIELLGSPAHKGIGNLLNQAAGDNQTIRARRLTGHVHYQVDGEVPPWMALVLVRVHDLADITTGTGIATSTPWGIQETMDALIDGNYETKFVKWLPVPKTTVSDEGVTHYGFSKFSIDLTNLKIINSEVPNVNEFAYALALVAGSYGENTVWSLLVRLAWYGMLHYDILDPLKENKF